MKYFRRRVHRLRLRVAPHWGAWIEIVGSTDDPTTSLSHPTGVRGLKYEMRRIGLGTVEVAPHWGAWIEISA